VELDGVHCHDSLQGWDNVFAAAGLLSVDALSPMLFPRHGPPAKGS
jgi:hypothetical protein